ncbi:MAG: cytochrome P450, partial [Dehalococcoidia bacterium]
LLSMLVLARDEEGDGGGMTDQQIRDESMTLFLAGHETTANALTWTWYLLSQRPEVEAELWAELDGVLSGRLPGVNDLSNLSYTRMVFSEALRLYPPAWIIGRQAIEEHGIGGYTLPAGATLVMSPYVIHRDPRFYPDPDRFDPLHWTPEAQAKRHRYSFFPFGGGSRLCIGEPFAWMEGVLVIASLAQRWRMRLAPGHQVGLQPLITLRPRGGMPMVLERRGQSR